MSVPVPHLTGCGSEVRALNLSQGASMPVEIFRSQFKAAAGEAAGVELSMRMLADKVPELRPFAHSKNFS
jgi:hypothetical protein